MRKKKKPIAAKVGLPASLDRINQMLKYRFSVKHINYVTDNGIIQHGWLVSNLEAITEAILLLKKQNAPVYIMGDLASAIIGWDVMHSNLVGSLWMNEKKVDEIQTIDMDILEKKMIEWYKKSRKGG